MKVFEVSLKHLTQMLSSLCFYVLTLLFAIGVISHLFFPG